MRAAWFGILGLGAALAIAATPAAGQSAREGEASKERTATPGGQRGPAQSKRDRAKAKGKADRHEGGKSAKAGKSGKSGKASQSKRGEGAGPGGGGDMLGNMYRTGHFRLVQDRLKSTFQSNPDDPDAHCMLGIAYENAGRYADAYTSLELGMGSKICDREGVGSMANTLRALGRPEEAAALRSEGLSEAPNLDSEMVMLLALSDDYRAAGDRLGAWDAVMRAWSLVPRGSLVFAAMADLAMDDGDMDDAGRLLWLTQWVPENPPAVRLTGVRYAILEGDIERAQELLVEIRPRTKRIWQGSVLQAELLRRSGDPEAAQLVLDAKYLRGSEYPGLLAEVVMVHSDLGEMSEAEENLDRALSLYPTDPDVLRARAYFESARKRR